MVTRPKASISALFARLAFLGILAALLALAAPGKAKAQARKMERTKATVRMTILTQHKMRGRQRLRRKHALIGNWQSSFTFKKRIDDDGF
jgi:hypothetical protein